MPDPVFQGTASPNVTARSLVLATTPSVAAPSSLLAWRGPPRGLARGTNSRTDSTMTETTTTTSTARPTRARSIDAFADAAAFRALSRSARVSFFGVFAVVVAIGRPWSTSGVTCAIGPTT